MIKAKAVSKDFWILKDGSIKVGEINNVQNHGTVMTIGGRHKTYSDVESIRQKTNIVFDNAVHKQPKKEIKDVHGYPFNGEVYNPVWDLKLNLPLYTKNEDSKSMFAAGWYMVNIRNKWESVLSPKLIILQRNEYKGPFKDKPETHHDTYHKFYW